MRCFVSVEIDDKLKGKISNMQEKLRGMNVGMKLVEPENLHFTIKFIGNVNESEVSEIINSLDNCLENAKIFTINVAGIGYFGRSSRIRTIWLGVKEGRDEFVNMMKNVNESVKFGEINLSPHLTIGRFKSGKNGGLLLKFIDEESDVNVGEMNVNEVKLKSSVLGKGGPVYHDLHVFKLMT